MLGASRPVPSRRRLGKELMPQLATEGTNYFTSLETIMKCIKLVKVWPKDHAVISAHPCTKPINSWFHINNMHLHDSVVPEDI
jgi:hypothetical protein